MSKPTDLPIWDTAEERVLQPDITRQTTGWVWGSTKFEKPKGEHFNWWMNNVYKWTAYFDETIGNIVANDSAVVHKTGDETIAGVKTFSSGIKIQNQNVSPFSGFKNYIINGGFDVWQRGESISGISSASVYRADRWFFRTSLTGATDLVASRKYSASYGNYLEYTYTGSTSEHYFRQSIENPIIFNKKTMTYSIDVINCSVVAGFDLLLVINNGTADIHIQTLKSGFFTTHTDVRPEGVRYSFTFEVPDLTSYDLSSPNSWLAVYPSTSWTGTGTFRFGRVQLEEGSVATPFENRPYGLELSLCQRYYETKVQQFDSSYAASSGQNRISTVSYKQPKRVNPTVVVSSITYVNSSSLVVLTSNIDGFASAATWTAAGRASAEYTWTASAEL